MLLAIEFLFSGNQSGSLFFQGSLPPLGPLLEQTGGSVSGPGGGLGS